MSDASWGAHQDAASRRQGILQSPEITGTYRG